MIRWEDDAPAPVPAVDRAAIAVLYAIAAALGALVGAVTFAILRVVV